MHFVVLGAPPQKLANIQLSNIRLEDTIFKRNTKYKHQDVLLEHK